MISFKMLLILSITLLNYTSNSYATDYNDFKDNKVKCRYFNGRPGSCKFGYNCNFSHIKETPAEYKKRHEIKSSSYSKKKNSKKLYTEKKKQESNNMSKEEYYLMMERNKSKQPIRSMFSSTNISNSSIITSTRVSEPKNYFDSSGLHIYKGTYNGMVHYETPAGSIMGSFCLD